MAKTVKPEPVIAGCKRSVLLDLLNDESILIRLNEHPGSQLEAIRDVLVPEARKRGYKVKEMR